MENEQFLSMNEIRTLQQKDFIIWANETMAKIGLTQKELSKITGCEASYLSNLLNFRIARKGSKWNEKIKVVLTKTYEQHSTGV